MNRGTGTGLIAFGVVLGVVGAVMAFAVTVTTSGFNINTAGWILLVVGIIVLLIGIAILGDRQPEELDNRRERPEHADWRGTRRGTAGLGLSLDRGARPNERLGTLRTRPEAARCHSLQLKWEVLHGRDEEAGQG